MRDLPSLLGTLLLTVVLSGCADDDGDDGVDTPDASVPAVLFEDISAGAGIPAAVVPPDPDDDPCQVLGEPCNPRGPSFGVGAAVADVDGDGRIDLYLAGPNGGTLLLNASSGPGDIRFVGGIAVGDAYVHGAAFGDLDGDGDEDLLLATTTGLRLFANTGDGAFSDATAGIGAAVPTVRAVSVAIADVNADGRLDAYVSDYGVPATASSTAPPSMLLINDGGLQFHDLNTAGPGRHDWAATFADIDEDGALDLVVATETWISEAPGEQPSSVSFHAGNNGDGDPVLVESAAFREEIVRFTTPMGVCVADPDADGQPELLINVLGPLVYVDRRIDGDGPRDLDARSTFAPSATEAFVAAWSCALEDFDGDGHVDAAVINGAPCVAGDCVESTPRSQPPRLLRYADDAFEYAAERPVAGAGGLAPDDDAFRNGRGLVQADFDADGRAELLVTPFSDAFRLYRRINVSGNALRVVLPRHETGATVTVSAGDRVRTRQLVAGGSTHSQSEPALAFELGAATEADVQIRWLDGSVDVHAAVPAGPFRVSRARSAVGGQNVRDGAQ